MSLFLEVMPVQVDLVKANSISTSYSSQEPIKTVSYFKISAACEFGFVTTKLIVDQTVKL